MKLILKAGKRYEYKRVTYNDNGEELREISIDYIGCNYEVLIYAFSKYSVRFDYVKSHVSFIKMHIAQ